MGAAAPLFALLILPELWKNQSSHTLEIECTTCYSLRQIYGARIFLFALVDITLLSIFSLTAIGSGLPEAPWLSPPGLRLLSGLHGLRLPHVHGIHQGPAPCDR